MGHSTLISIAPATRSRLSKKDRAGPESAHRLRAWPETLGKPAQLSVWQATARRPGQILVSYQPSNLKAGAVHVNTMECFWSLLRP
jgi:hypothetical protein